MAAYDMLVRAVENRVGNNARLENRRRVPIKELVRFAPVFDFGEVWDQTIDADDLVSSFHMPFPEFCVSTPTFAFLLMNEREEGFVGADVWRFLVFAVQASDYRYLGATRVRATLSPELERPDSGWKATELMRGSEDGETVGIFVDHGYILDEMTNEHLPEDEANEAIGYAFAQAMAFTYEINNPKKFIVEKTPRRVRPLDSPKIPRLHERKTLTVLDRRQVDDLFKIPRGSMPSGIKRRSHRRRGYMKTLRSDYFVNAQGKSIYIKPTWVGPEEVTKEGKHYKVRLDISGIKSSTQSQVGKSDAGDSLEQSD